MPEPDPTIAERAREARLTIARHLADLHRHTRLEAFQRNGGKHEHQIIFIP